jgi:hypothetical protein
VHGQFAELAVKKQMNAFLQKQEEKKLKRKGFPVIRCIAAAAHIMPILQSVQ